MKLEPWEPDLRTLVAREHEGELDLQPDFQRGLAWNTVKQQRLIDTMLRGWSIPPLHVLTLPEEKLAVLDGQQRLRSIIRFVDNKLRIGSFQPYDPEVEQYKGLFFKDLPEPLRRRIYNYKLSCYRLYEYEPDEPHELFFRLNLPTGLTQAEKRNALVGDSRFQVKQLVELAVDRGWSIETIGFANARLAYDDIIARTCSYVESGSLRIPLTANDLEAQYRRKGGFSSSTVETVENAVLNLSSAVEQDHLHFRLNKATLTTWLLVFCRAELDPNLSGANLDEFMTRVERGRVASRRPDPDKPLEISGPPEIVRRYLELYNDRASLRVTDVLSVVSRDAVIWRLAAMQDENTLESPNVARLVDGLKPIEENVEELEWRTLRRLEDPELWGSLR